MAVAHPVESVCKCGGFITKCISFPSVYRIKKQLEEYMACERTGKCSPRGTEGPAELDSSSVMTADISMRAPALNGTGRILHRGGLMRTNCWVLGLGRK